MYWSKQRLLVLTRKNGVYREDYQCKQKHVKTHRLAIYVKA